MNWQKNHRSLKPRCRVRLCELTYTVADGIVIIDANKQNTKFPKYALMTIKSCPECGRTVEKFWDQERRKQYREQHRSEYL